MFLTARRAGGEDSYSPFPPEVDVQVEERPLSDSLAFRAQSALGSLSSVAVLESYPPCVLAPFPRVWNFLMELA